MRAPLPRVPGSQREWEGGGPQLGAVANRGLAFPEVACPRGSSYFGGQWKSRPGLNPENPFHPNPLLINLRINSAHRKFSASQLALSTSFCRILPSETHILGSVGSNNIRTGIPQEIRRLMHSQFDRTQSIHSSRTRSASAPGPLPMRRKLPLRRFPFLPAASSRNVSQFHTRSGACRVRASASWPARWVWLKTKPGCARRLKALRRGAGRPDATAIESIFGINYHSVNLGLGRVLITRRKERVDA